MVVTWPNVSVMVRLVIRQALPAGTSTASVFQSLPQARTNSTSAILARSSGPAAMAPRSADESSISHQRGAGMPRNATGWGTAVSVSASAAAVAPSGWAVVPSNEYQSRLPLAYCDAASVSSVPAPRLADTANWYSIASSVH